MTLIDDEIDEVSRLCENVIPNSKLVACQNTLVRVEVQQSCMRRLTICIRFPENYPKTKLLLEFKSKTLSSTFLDKFINLCETRLNDAVEKPQVMWILKFISDYLLANPLCIILDELQQIKQLLSTFGELKVKQRACTIELIVRAEQYYYQAKFKVPNDYPNERVAWDDCECNLPLALVLFINGQAKEIARQCVEPPLAAINTNASFKPKRSLQICLAFVVTTVRNILQEKCPICGHRCLPENPSDNITRNTDDLFLVRMFCGHIYHQGCLKRFMSEPPFPRGGKTCPAQANPRHDAMTLRSDEQCLPMQSASNLRLASDAVCGQRVTHDKWGLNNVKAAETKWAHRQAKIRELEEDEGQGQVTIAKAKNRDSFVIRRRLETMPGRGNDAALATVAKARTNEQQSLPALGLRWVKNALGKWSER
uniref:RING-type domain-containing protein n=1 Tax=Anopheles minimus TaxID=112268 RepID=A0A182W854_9DIPT